MMATYDQLDRCPATVVDGRCNVLRGTRHVCASGWGHEEAWHTCRCGHTWHYSYPQEPLALDGEES